MSVLAPGRNIVLIGLMGAGKSSVGRRLAKRLGRPFVDTDELVEKDASKSIAEIFAIAGERAFREQEAAAVRRVAALRGQVIAVGGGAVLDPANVTQLRATGDIVWLDADPEALAVRVGDGSTRPLLHGHDPHERLTELRDQRGPAYAAAATFVVDTTGQSPDEVVSAIIAEARRRPGLLSRDEPQA